jgi:hypothetical protein
MMFENGPFPFKEPETRDASVVWFCANIVLKRMVTPFPEVFLKSDSLS